MTPRRRAQAAARASRSGTGPRRAIVYTRVSTGQQAESGLSLDAQERHAVARAEADGYTVEVVREEGRSGGSLRGRPLFLAALDRLDAGDAHALYVAKADRLSRKVRDTLNIAERAADHGWRLMVLDPEVDLSSPWGQAMLIMAQTFAQLELAAISERHKAWHAEARQRGKRWGVDYGPRSSLPEEVRRRVVSEHEAGASMSAIARGLNDDGVPAARGGRWSHSQVRAVLESPASEVVA